MSFYRLFGKKFIASFLSAALIASTMTSAALPAFASFDDSIVENIDDSIINPVNGYGLDDHTQIESNTENTDANSENENTSTPDVNENNEINDEVSPVLVNTDEENQENTEQQIIEEENTYNIPQQDTEEIEGVANEEEAPSDIDTRAIIGYDPVSGDPIYETYDVYDEQYPRIQRARTFSTTSTKTIDPSDLSTWTVFTRYYKAGWNATTPGDWNTTVNSTGYHPYFYFSETYNTGYYYDLDTDAGIQKLETERLKPSAASNTVAHFSKHIYTKGTANNADITFLGYGTSPFTDFALAPVTYAGLKTIGFDILAKNIDTHTLKSFGIMINAGVNASNMFDGYILNFGQNSGTISVQRLSNNASTIHSSAVNTGTVVGSATYTKGDKIRVELEILPTEVMISVTPYVSETSTALNEAAKKITSLTLPADTGYSGFGPTVTYTSHGCSSLSFIRFSNIQMATNYSLIFDSNGGTMDQNESRINDIEPGKSMDDYNHQFPTPPTRDGYTFVGWNTQADGEGAEFKSSDVLSKITTVYAKWIKDYSLTYVAGANGSLGSDGPANNQETMIGNALPSAVPTPIPSSREYEFSHWQGSDNVSYTEAEILSVAHNKDITFTAVFVAIPKYTVKYAVQGNGSLSGSSSEDVLKGDTIDGAKVPTPVAGSGSEFKYWVDDSGNKYYTSNDIANVTPTAGMTLTAVFEVMPKITYKSGENGSLQGGDSFEYIPEGKNPSNVPTPVSSDDDKYEFKHWEDQNGNTYLTNADVELIDPAGDLTLTAVFGKYTSGVEYKAGENGSLTGTTEYPDAGLNFTLKEDATAPTPVPDSKYTFVGWTDADGNTIDPEKDIVGGNTSVIIANFKPDNNEDGVDDDLQDKFKVSLDVVGSGSLNGTTEFTVVEFEKTGKDSLNKALEGFVEPTKVPDTSVDSTMKFWWWMDGNDASTSNIVNNIGTEEISSDTTYYAFFDTDKDNDGQPDSLQDSFVVEFKVEGNGKIVGDDSFTVLENKNNNQVLGDSIDGFVIPEAVADTNNVFYCWEDSNGNEIPDIENYKITGDSVIVARFEKDENGDNVADVDQTYYDVTLATRGPGQFVSGSTINYVVIEREKTGEAPLGDALGGFSAPGTAPTNSQAKFWWWEDEAYNQIQDLEKHIVGSDCTLYAFFDTDNDGDGQPDSLQESLGAEFKVTENGGGRLIGTTQFTVLQNKDGDQLLKDSVGGYTQPSPRADAGYVFYCWKDAVGKEISDPAEYSIKGSNTVIYAHFERDENGDGMADCDQNIYTLTFVSPAEYGTLSGTTEFKFIGGTKGDGKPLTASHVVGSKYSVPKALPNTVEFVFNGWTPVNDAKEIDVNSPQISGDWTYSADYSEKEYSVKFVSNGATLENISSIKNSETVGSKLSPTFAQPASTASQTFSYWNGSNGMRLSTNDAKNLNPNSDVTFTAVFAKKGLNK